MGHTLLGVDVGTESVRVLIVDERGRHLASSAWPLRTTFPRPGWAEQDPEEVWAALVGATREARLMVPEPIAALALATTSVTLVTSDDEGAPTGPAILWMDTRSSAEADEVTETGHPALWYTGGRVSPEWMLPKALWLARHEPERYRAATPIASSSCTTGCCTGSRASGRRASVSPARAGHTCPSAVAGPSICLRTSASSTRVRAGPMRRAPPTHPSVSSRRRPRRSAISDAGTLVAHGTMDSYAAALSCGVLARGRLAVSLGSSSCYLAEIDVPRADPRLLGPVPDAFEPGRYGIQGGQTSAGSVVRWFRTQFAADTSFAELDAEAARWPIGAGGVRAIETFQGSRTPHRDPSRRGALYGLNLAHERGAVYRALLEAVAVGGRLIVDAMRESCPVESVVACGGATRSPLWMQMHADALGVPLETLDERDAAALGAAVSAATCAGIYPDLGTAAASMMRLGARYTPNPDAAEEYAGLLRDYVAAGDALAALR